MEENNIPNEYKPVSLWAYVGLMALNMIPCVGLIATIVFACGAIKNKNIINFARAQLVLAGIIVAIYLIILMFGLAGGIMSGFMDGISRGSRYYY